MKYIIGIDIGTTATKAVAYNLETQAIKAASSGYPLIEDLSGQAEEDPKLIFDAVQNVIYRLTSALNDEVIAISFSSQMHSLIGLDQSGQLLTNSYTWADNRAQAQVAKAKKSGLGKMIYHETGMPIHPMAPIYKLLYLKNINRQLYQSVAKWVGIKEYIIYRLTGELAEDTTIAAGTGLLNLKEQNWDENLLSKLGLTKDNFPKLVQPVQTISEINSEYQNKLGLSKKTQIIVGASDGYLSTIGVGVLDESHIALNVGTSGAIRTISKQINLNKQTRHFVYPIDQDHYLNGAPVNNGGIIFAWAQKLLLDHDKDAQDLLDLAQTASTGSNGLIFHPYLGGERAPIWDPNARGSFVGLNRNHTKAQVARSVIEGIIYNLFDASSAIIDQKQATIRVTGGFMRSDFVKQLTANIFNHPVQEVNNAQSGSFAAMFLARLALGLDRNLKDINKYLHINQTFYPDEQEVAIYQDYFKIYQDLKLDLAKSYDKLSRLQNK